MGAVVRDLRTFLARKFSRSEELEESIATVRAERAAAEVAVEKMRQERKALLLTADDDALAKHDEALSAASRRRERAAAVAEELEGRRSEIVKIEDEAARKAKYSEAAARLGAAEKDLSAFEKHAKALRDLTRAMAEADLLVEAANRDLPKGAQPLRSIGDRFFLPYLPKEVVKEERVEIWVGEVDGAPVPEHRIGSIVHNGSAMGFLPPQGDPGSRNPSGDDPKRVVKRSARRQTVLSAVEGRFISGLASSLAIPGLMPNAPFFIPAPSDMPADVIAHMDEMERQAKHPRQSQVVLKLHEDTGI